MDGPQGKDAQVQDLFHGVRRPDLGNIMTDPAGSAGGAPTNTPTMTKTATRRMPPTIPARPPHLRTLFSCSIFCTSFISLSCTIRACLGQSLSYIPPTHFLRVLCPWSA